MHEIEFSSSVLPLRRVCLFLELKTYSIGHELLLINDGNPILCWTEAAFNAMPKDEQKRWLRRAVLICYRDWRGQRRPERNLRLWSALTDGLDWGLELAEFRNYLKEQRSMLRALSASNPEDVEAYEIANKGEELGGRALGAPFLAQLIHFAMGQEIPERLDERPFWKRWTRPPLVYDVPFALAANLLFTELECAGALKIENFRERQARDEMTQHRADIEKEKAAARAAWDMAKTEEERLRALEKHPRIFGLFEGDAIIGEILKEHPDKFPAQRAAPAADE